MWACSVPTCAGLGESNAMATSRGRCAWHTLPVRFGRGWGDSWFVARPLLGLSPIGPLRLPCGQAPPSVLFPAPAAFSTPGVHLSRGIPRRPLGRPGSALHHVVVDSAGGQQYIFVCFRIYKQNDTIFPHALRGGFPDTQIRGCSCHLCKRA